MKLLTKRQTKTPIPLYQEEYIDWFVKSGNSEATAKKYIRHFKNLYERILKRYWTESAMFLYSNAVNGRDKTTNKEQCIPNIDDFLEEIKDMKELLSVPYLSPAFNIAILCFEKAQEDIEKLEISQNTFNQWRSAYNSYIDFIKYLYEKRVQECLCYMSEEKCDIQLRSLRLPLIDEYEEWQKKQIHMDYRAKSNYLSLLKDLHTNIFPDLDPTNASPFDLIMPFLPNHIYVATDILQKYANILREEMGCTEHFSALNQYIKFLNDQFGNTVNKPMDNITPPLPPALKYDLNSFKIQIYEKTEIIEYIKREFQRFRQIFKDVPRIQEIVKEDFSKILVMTENGFIKLSNVDNMVVIPWQEFTAIKLNDDEAFQVFSPNSEDDIVKAVVRTLDDLEVRLWSKWLVLSVKDYKKYPDCKYRR